jgi:ADP-heptose:LPS heptosyltransferase
MKGPIPCLVLQLGGGTEILQSLIALKAAKQLYPAMEITLVCREEYAGIPAEVSWLEDVVALPIARWANPINAGAKLTEDLLPEAAQAIARLAGTQWDILANWTFNDSSSFLSALIPAQHRLGYTRRADLDFSSGDGWSQFIHAFIQQGVPQNIHLVDILTTQLLTALQVRHGDPIDAGNQPVTGKDFFTSLRTAGDKLLDPSRTWIGIQVDPFWTARQWARLIELATERHPEIQVVLLGEESRRELAREAIKAVAATITEKRVLNLVGETDLDLWVDCITQCDWIITGNGLPANLSSILGTRALQVCREHSPDFTGAAYGNGHLFLHPTDLSVPVVPEAAYAAWSYLHFEWSHRRSRNFEQHLASLGFGGLSDWIDLRISRIRPSDDGGGVTYESEFTRPLAPKDWLAVVNGQIARLWYCGWTAAEGSELTRATIRPVLLQELRALDESSSVLLRVSREAVRSARELHQRAVALKSSKIMSVEDREDLESRGKRILELQKLVDRLAKADEHLAGFSTLLKVMMHNLEGEHIAEISRETAVAWQQVERGAELMRSWLKHTLQMARPMAVVPEPFQPTP